MKPLQTVTGTAVLLPADDVNTDQITPLPESFMLDQDYAALLFAHLRRKPDGSPDPDFPLNKPAYRDARILVTGRNFGCGSSREGAVLALLKSGFRCVIARSFAEIFRENCIKNSLLPVVLDETSAIVLEEAVTRMAGATTVTVDLVHQRIVAPDMQTMRFSIGASDRLMLMEGLDEIDLTMKHAAAIDVWERSMRRDCPWLQAVIGVDESELPVIATQSGSRALSSGTEPDCTVAATARSKSPAWCCK